nr:MULTISPECIES: discoidin domain-containing protein [unclassified Micromonospora]
MPGSRTVLSRSGWTATASGGADTAARMLDGDTGTRWTSGAPMTNGQSFTVDMRSVRTVSGVSLLSTGADHARGYQVFLSTDGRNWTGPVASGKGFTNQTLVDFEARDARHVRVVQTGSASNWWSVAEFTVFSG